MHGRIGKGDVFVDRAIEQDVFLKDDADVPAQPAGIRLGDIGAIKKDLALLRDIESLDKLRQRGFARARGADNADHIALIDGERYVLQDFLPTGAVAETHVAELDSAARRRQRRATLRPKLRRRVQDVAQPFDRHLHLLEILPDLRQAQDGLRRLARDHVEGDQLANRQVAIHHGARAEHEDQRHGHAVDVLNGVLTARQPPPRRETAGSPRRG